MSGNCGLYLSNVAYTFSSILHRLKKNQQNIICVYFYSYSHETPHNVIKNTYAELGLYLIQKKKTGVDTQICIIYELLTHNFINWVIVIIFNKSETALFASFLIDNYIHICYLSVLSKIIPEALFIMFVF